MRNLKNNDTRKCCFCGSEFSIARYLPSVSCPACRNKEAHARSLTVKTCLYCGTKFSTAPHSFLCRKCVSTFRNASDVIKKTCMRCGKPMLSLPGMPDACCLCYKEILREGSHNCIYCGVPMTKKGTVCNSCKKEYTGGGRVCFNCRKGFVPGSYSDPMFCCASCKNEWSRWHTGKSRCSTIGRSTDEIKKAAAKIMADAPELTCLQVIKKLGVTQQTLVRRKIVLSDIRTELNLPAFVTSMNIFETMVLDNIKKVWPSVERQKWFPDLVDKRPLRYDFYVPNLNLLIEADGPQHYTKTTGVYSYLNTDNVVLRHDIMKNSYAEANGISLLRIMYFRERDSAKRMRELVDLFTHIQCTYQETGRIKLFNCWKGGKELLPISSQASQEEGSETIP